MSTRTRFSMPIAGLIAVVAFAAACGDPGQSGTEEPDPAEGQGCAPVPGDDLVVLEDDQQLQLAENVVPAVNEDAATPELIAALDVVSAALDTPKLIGLNRAVNVDRQTSAVAAEEFATAEGLTEDIPAGSGSGSLVIGAANFAESQTLGELYRVAVEAAGFEAEVQTIGNRELYEPALERGEVHVVPEYVGSLTVFLNPKVNGADPEPLASGDLATTMEALRGLGEEVGLVFGEPSAAVDQNAFAVTSAFAEEYGVRTLTELGEKCSGAATILGGPPECPQRPFCQVGLEDTYGLEVGGFSSLDAGGPLTKEALRTGEISVGTIFSSDGELAPPE